jgi:hypothetical protein
MARRSAARWTKKLVRRAGETTTHSFLERCFANSAYLLRDTVLKLLFTSQFFELLASPGDYEGVTARV